MDRPKPNPDDRMNVNLPVQLFFDEPKKPKKPPKRKAREESPELFTDDPIDDPRTPSRSSPSRERTPDFDPDPLLYVQKEFNFHGCGSPRLHEPTEAKEIKKDKVKKKKKKKKEDKKGKKKIIPKKKVIPKWKLLRNAGVDPRFHREPEVIFCGDRGRKNVCSSMSDLLAHFMRTAANIVVHRFSNYGRDDINRDMNKFKEKQFQFRLPYMFCMIPEIKEYIDDSIHGIRNRMGRGIKIEKVCFALVDNDELPLFEANIDFWKTEHFRNYRTKGPYPPPCAELRPQLVKALFQLQQLQLGNEKMHQLMRTSTGFRIRYQTYGDDDDDMPEECKPPNGWEEVWRVGYQYCQELHPWVNSIRTEFLQMEFFVETKNGKFSEDK